MLFSAFSFHPFTTYWAITVSLELVTDQSLYLYVYEYIHVYVSQETYGDNVNIAFRP